MPNFFGDCLSCAVVTVQKSTVAQFYALTGVTKQRAPFPNNK